MRRKKLEWNAFNYNSNSKNIEVFNVISDELIKDITQANKKGKITKYDDLKEIIRRHFMYYYWCKSEHEVLITDLFINFRENEDKVFKKDVYFQLEMNLDRIVEYIDRELNVLDKGSMKNGKRSGGKR